MCQYISTWSSFVTWETPIPSLGTNVNGSHQAPIPSQIFASINSDVHGTSSSPSSPSTKNLIPKFSSAAYKRVEIAVRPPLTKTSRTEESRKAWIVRDSEALSSEVVKRVWGASSGVVFIRFEDKGPDVDVDVDGNVGRVILKVSVHGSKDRVVLRVKSVSGVNVN